MDSFEEKSTVIRGDFFKPSEEKRKEISQFAVLQAIACNPEQPCNRCLLP